MILLATRMCVNKDGGVLDEDAPSVPTSMPCDEEVACHRLLFASLETATRSARTKEVDARMLHMVVRLHQLPTWWARCSEQAPTSVL